MEKFSEIQHGSCVTCGGHDFTKMKYAAVVFFLNPITWVSELILGQRFPRELFRCQSCKRKFGYAQCPACHSMHLSALWYQTLGHWFGWVCPTCQSIIPCRWSLFAWLVVAATSPIWYVPYKLLKPGWLKYENHRVARQTMLPVKTSWIVEWLSLSTNVWSGYFLFYLYEALSHHNLTTLRDMVLRVPFIIFGGLVAVGFKRAVENLIRFFRSLKYGETKA